jgi:hypothetical protein
VARTGWRGGGGRGARRSCVRPSSGADRGARMTRRPCERSDTRSRVGGGRRGGAACRRPCQCGAWPDGSVVAPAARVGRGMGGIASIGDSKMPAPCRWRPRAGSPAARRGGGTGELDPAVDGDEAAGRTLTASFSQENRSPFGWLWRPFGPFTQVVPPSVNAVKLSTFRAGVCPPHGARRAGSCWCWR